MAITLGLGVTYHDTSVETSAKSPIRAIFGYGNGATNKTNLVNNYGGVALDTTGVGTARAELAAAGYGGDKVIFGYGQIGAYVSMTNLVSNIGVVAGDITGVGTGRKALAAATYGGDKAIFGYGEKANNTAEDFTAVTNKVSNTGVVVTDTAGIGIARRSLAAASYGVDKAIFSYGAGNTGGGGGVSTFNIPTNLVSNTGVVGASVTGVGTGRSSPAAAGYGGDKAIFGYGAVIGAASMTNLVSNTGIIAADVTNITTARYILAAAGYGGDKAIFGYGTNNTGTPPSFSLTNLVSNTGVVGADITGVGTARYGLAAASYSS